MTVVTSRADFEKLMVLRMTEAKLLLEQKDCRAIAHEVTN